MSNKNYEYEDDNIVDGEDYAIAIRNLKKKYGEDSDINTIIQFCEQWQNSYAKMEGSRNKMIIELTKLEAKYRENILDRIIQE